MKKSKYQKYFHCFNVSILGPYAFCFSFSQNIVTFLISAVFRGAALITARRLFQCISVKHGTSLGGGKSEKSKKESGSMVQGRSS